MDRSWRVPGRTFAFAAGGTLFVDLIKAFILGIVEGLTEFLPISSTGHLILAEHYLGFQGPLAITLAIFIQLGAILAVVWHYRRALTDLVVSLPREPRAQHMVRNLVIAFIPAAGIGFLFHEQITFYLFKPVVIATSLIIGGFIILWVERRAIQPTTLVMEEMTARQALWVGIAQIASLVPGVSRAGATIIGGMLAGVQRSPATEFSFWLAIPTLILAAFYELFASLDTIQPGDWLILAVGTVTSFVVALVVIRAFLRYVRTKTLDPFGYYRIVLGILVLVLTWLWR